MSGTIEPEFAGVRGIENTTPEFRVKLREVALRIGANPRDLANVMAFETGGTFSPSVRNPRSSATGLIQFMEYTAPGLGTSIEALARMTAIEQLDYVEKYFKPHKKKGLGSEHDLYMAVLYPTAVGKGVDHVLFKRGTKNYRDNAGLDRNKDGVILAGEASSTMLGGAGAKQGRRSRDNIAKGADSKSPAERRRTSKGDAARSRDGLVSIHRIAVPAAEVTSRPEVKPATAAEAVTNPAADRAREPHVPEDVNIFGAIAGLFAVAAEHYKGRDPELATRYDAIASALTSMMCPELPSTALGARGQATRAPADRGLSIDPSS